MMLAQEGKPPCTHLALGRGEALSLLLGHEANQVLEALVTQDLCQLVPVLHKAEDGVHTETGVTTYIQLKVGSTRKDLH